MHFTKVLYLRNVGRHLCTVQYFRTRPGVYTVLYCTVPLLYTVMATPILCRAAERTFVQDLLLYCISALFNIPFSLSGWKRRRLPRNNKATRQSSPGGLTWTGCQQIDRHGSEFNGVGNWAAYSTGTVVQSRTVTLPLPYCTHREIRLAAAQGVRSLCLALSPSPLSSLRMPRDRGCRKERRQRGKKGKKLTQKRFGPRLGTGGLGRRWETGWWLDEPKVLVRYYGRSLASKSSY